MNKHSFWSMLTSVLANLHSKFVKHGVYVLRDASGETVLSLRTRLPFEITAVTTDRNGKIELKVERRTL